MPGGGFPWAVAIAVLLVLGSEFALNLVPSRSMLGYGSGLGTFYEVRHSIEEIGAAEVSVLGSSRGREAVVMPMLVRNLEERLGRPVSAANYSCPDAKTDEMLLITRTMMSSQTPPRVVLYIISPRAFHGDRTSMQRAEVFGVFPNQYGNDTKLWLASLSERPLWESRNILQDHYLTFRYRYRFRNLMASAPRKRRMLSPVQGDETTWHYYTPDRSLENHPVRDRQIRSFVDRLLDDDGNYIMGDNRLASLRDIAHACSENGAKLVLVSAPISEDLARHMPAGMLTRFRNLLDSVAVETGTTVIHGEDLGVTFTKADFREQSHLNRSGAEKMTQALADRIIGPYLALTKSCI